ncbi:DUF3489 domain-containing protein [Nitratireductor mangrovi]|nr:DUF3489 domain-containing protein [Nitratireductor mangrovi]
MTDETKTATDPAIDGVQATPRKTRKPEANTSIGSAMSYPPQLRRVEPEMSGSKPGSEATQAKPRAARTRKKPARSGASGSDSSVVVAGKKQAAKVTKTETALKVLRRKRGASIAEMQELTGWQAHSVRGFLSGTVKKKLGLQIVSDAGKDGVRRYRIDDAGRAG